MYKYKHNFQWPCTFLVMLIMMFLIFIFLQNYDNGKLSANIEMHNSRYNITYSSFSVNKGKQEDSFI